MNFLHPLNKRLWILVIFFLSLCLIAWTKFSSPINDQKVSYVPAKKECLRGEKWKACVYSAVEGTNEDIAYHLHGKDLDENTWNDDTFYTSQIQKYWSIHKQKPPKVVTVSFGSLWFLLPKNSNPNSGLMDVFLGEVMPEVEKKTGIPKKRIVFGESMGGVNSLLLALNTKGLFNKAISMCPVLYKESLFSSYQKILELLNRTGATPKNIFGVISIAKKYVSDESHWKEFSPIELLEKANPSTTPELYLSCGLYDKYGNFEGAEYFAEKAKALGFKIHWRPLYGGHCVTDVASVAEQLL